MPKAIRQCPGGFIYHVLNRANGRATIFHTAGDYAAFEGILAEGLARMPMRLIAYCLMPNHWHLLLQPYKDGDLSSFMHWVTVTHSQRWHTAHDAVGYGHLYQGRFKSFPVQGQYYYLTVLRYIEGNPLRAGLVKSSVDWRWSSLLLRGGTAKGNLSLSVGPMELPRNWNHVVNTLMQPKDVGKLEQSVRRGVPFGDDTWVDQTAKAMQLAATLRPRGRPRKRVPDPFSEV
jgi:putative transposase